MSVHRLPTKDSLDERIREIQDGKRLLFDGFARRSEAEEFAWAVSTRVTSSSSVPAVYQPS